MLLEMLLWRYCAGWRSLLFSSRLFYPRFGCSCDSLLPALYVILLSLVTFADGLLYLAGSIGIDFFLYQDAERKYYLSLGKNDLETLVYYGAIKLLAFVQMSWVFCFFVECGLTVLAAAGATVSYLLGILLRLVEVLDKQEVHKPEVRKTEVHRQPEVGKPEVNKRPEGRAEEATQEERAPEAEESVMRQDKQEGTSQTDGSELRSRYFGERNRSEKEAKPKL